MKKRPASPTPATPKSNPAKSTSKKPTSIQDYLAAQDATKAKTLRAIIDLILAEYPELESKISWNVPVIHRKENYITGLCAYKNHLTFSPWSPHIIETFKPRLEKYVLFKNCFQIPIDWKIDTGLIKDLVHARLAELDPQKKTDQ